MSDKRIRELERIAFETKNSQDIANYWKTCLRVGILPKNTDQSLEGGLFWKLEPNNFPEHPSYYVSWNKSDNYINYPDINIPTGNDGTMHNLIAIWERTSRYINESVNTPATKIEQTIKYLLEWVLHGWETNQESKSLQPPDRKNPDKKIRRLEREGQNEIQEAIEKIRAGIILEPDEVVDSSIEISSADIWETKIAKFNFGTRHINVEYFTEREPNKYQGSVLANDDVGPLEPFELGMCQKCLNWTSYSQKGNTVLHNNVYCQHQNIEFEKTNKVGFFFETQNPELPVWHYPIVINLIYLALTSSVVSKRKNPDETIRKKERLSLQESGKLSDEAKLEILRRGEYIPWFEGEENEEGVSNRHWFIGEWELFASIAPITYENRKISDRWTLFTWVFSTTDEILKDQALAQKLSKERKKFPDNNLLKDQIIQSESLPWDHPLVKNTIISYLYPMVLESIQRQNPDERIRRSQRDNNSIQAALEQLRAGIFLEPTHQSAPAPLESGAQDQVIFDFGNSQRIRLFNTYVRGTRGWKNSVWIEVEVSDNQEENNIFGIEAWGFLNDYSLILPLQELETPIWHYPEVVEKIYQAVSALAAEQRKSR